MKYNEGGSSSQASRLFLFLNHSKIENAWRGASGDVPGKAALKKSHDGRNLLRPYERLEERTHGGKNGFAAVENSRKEGAIASREEKRIKKS